MSGFMGGGYGGSYMMGGGMNPLYGGMGTSMQQNNQMQQ
jgi:hypothetical protein